MKIVDNILYGDTVGSKTNLISDEEYASDYEYICSFDEDTYLKKINLSISLSNYKELLLILCKKSDNTILNTTHISEYDINRMTNNYEFSDGSFDLEKIYDANNYMISISVKDKDTIYVTCNNISKGYLFR